MTTTARHAAPSVANAVPTDDLHTSTVNFLKATAVGIVLGETVPEDAALVILSQPAIRAGLAARRFLTEMAAEHYPIARRPGSLDLVCAKCGTGWSCEYAERFEAIA